MIELSDTFPDINVDPAEYTRLLGYPRGHLLSGRARELAHQARAWYAKNGHPWVYARQCEAIHLDPQSPGNLTIDGESFTSTRLSQMLREAEATSAFLVAVSAGPELEAEAERLWLAEKPDEYFFLEIFGSAIVEHLTTMTGARLCAWADRNAMAVLPHYSPGYPEWDISQQPRLMDLLRRGHPLPERIEVLSSGMLRPKKSLLAVFGLTRHTQRVQRLTGLIPCENCSFANCQYRRVPYARAQLPEPEIAIAEPGGSADAQTAPTPEPLTRNATYGVNAKALRRWADERLTLTPHPDGSITALFRYDGTTCSNMGRPLTFHYHVKIGPQSEGYPIKELLCTPAPGDEGHKFMCRYMSNAEHLMVAIDHEKPLLGRPLNDAITWSRPETGAGCYCEPASRQHKWGLALETIHFALVQREDCLTNQGRQSPNPSL